MNNVTEVKILNIEDVTPDPHQPRKYFSAEKMKFLRKSIQELGIMTPLVVEKIGDKYLLIDGERRYRAATELKLKEVPALIEAPQSAVQRLLRQFSIQEQHEAWTPIEKAQSLIKLSEELGLTLAKTCELLGIPDNMKDRYVAFAQLADRSGYVHNEIPLDYAEGTLSFVRAAKRISRDELEKELTRSDEKKLEERIIQLVKEGHIKRRSDIVQLKDSMTKNPKLIQEFIESGGTPAEMFSRSKARGAYHLRNTIQQAGYMRSHGASFLKIRDVKVTTEQVEQLKMAIKVAQEIIDLTEF